jgi:hypothetical protein
MTPFRLVILGLDCDDKLYTEMRSSKWMLPRACRLLYSDSLVSWYSNKDLHLS